jgi:hypothetical protein
MHVAAIGTFLKPRMEKLANIIETPTLDTHLFVELYDPRKLGAFLDV